MSGNYVEKFLQQKPPEEEPEEVQIDEPEEELPQRPKKRVIGRMPRQHQRMSPPVERPNPQQVMGNLYAPRQQQPIFQPSVEQRAHEAAMIELMKQQELQLFYEKQMRSQQPRVSTSKKLLNVANAAAGTRGRQQINTFKKDIFKRPTMEGFNSYIQSVAPKVVKNSKKKKFW